MTGSRNGMTVKQKTMFVNFLWKYSVTTLHHGDCIGADDDSDTLAREHGASLVIHPPIKDDLRAWNTCRDEDEMREEKGYFARNRDIVDETNILVGFPGTFSETKGGTWYTINYGKKQNKTVYIIWPDGRLELVSV